MSGVLCSMKYHTTSESTSQLVVRPPGLSFSCFSLFGKLFILVSLWKSVSFWIPWWKNVKCANSWPLHCSLWMLLRNIFYDETSLKLENAQQWEPSPSKFFGCAGWHSCLPNCSAELFSITKGQVHLPLDMAGGMDAEWSARDHREEKDTLRLFLVEGNLRFWVQRTNEYKWKASTKIKPLQIRDLTHL